MLVLALIALLTAVAVPAAARLLDGIAVRAASSEAYAMFGVARQLAVMRGRLTVLEIDTAAGKLLIRAEAETLRVREIRDVHRVRLTASRLATIYAQNGLGYGVSNLTLILSRGGAADTLVVSRLGRVRR